MINDGKRYAFTFVLSIVLFHGLIVQSIHLYGVFVYT